MPGFNVSVQQYTPLIRYAPPSAWGPGSPADSQFSKYNDGFRLTTANGSTATFNFNGTGVWIYGAYRPNHGNFSVTLDGTPQGVYNGSTKDQFQVVLFGAVELENINHSIELTNIPISNNNNYVDIDFITYEMQLDEKSIANPVQVDVSSGNWTYDDLWNLEKDSTQSGLLTSTAAGAQTTLTFQGETVEVYGSTGPLNSQFDVSIDGGANTTFDCYYDESRPSVLLWSANSLGDVPHKLEITNRPNSTSRNKLALDYALVRSATKQTTSIGAGATSTSVSAAPTSKGSPTESTALNSNAGAITGGVIGAVVLLVGVAAAVLHWQRKKRLVERPALPYIPPMSSSGNVLPTTNPPARSGLQGSHPKYGAPIRATASNPATFRNIPSERVPIIGDPFSSDDLGISTTLGSNSQLSASTAASSNVKSRQPMVLPVSPDSRAIHQPRERFAQPLSHLHAFSSPRTQPLPLARSNTPTEPRRSLSQYIQTPITVQPHSSDGSPSAFTSTPAQTSHSTGSIGMPSSYAHQPHPQSAFGDWDDTPDRSGYQSRITSPPPDYYSSAGHGAL